MITDVHTEFLNVKTIITHLHVQLSILHIPSAGEGFMVYSSNFTCKLDMWQHLHVSHAITHLRHLNIEIYSNNLK